VESLKSYNTFGIDVNASEIHVFTNAEELKLLYNKYEGEKILILGGGSNVLFTKDFEGVVFVNGITGVDKILEDKDSVIIKTGGGEIWHDFVLKTLDNNWYGLENLSLIPGSVGACPMQNIGAYGVEIKDVFHELEAYNIATQKVEKFKYKDCDFGYRTSVFKTIHKNKYVILNVSFKLLKTPSIDTSYGVIADQLDTMGVSNPTPKDVSNAVIAIRNSKLPNPLEVGNGGSFFKNPVVATEIAEKLLKDNDKMPSYKVNETHTKIPAGWLIENAGWKGKTFDNYGVYPKQALVLVNYGGASGEQIFNLSSEIINDVNSKFGIILEREVNII
jgi:UDP-N-acetylmuramate dehydrogenase